MTRALRRSEEADQPATLPDGTGYQPGTAPVPEDEMASRTRQCTECGITRNVMDFPSYMVADPGWPPDKPLPCRRCFARIDDREYKTHPLPG